jgi:hypothetical protein
MCPASQPVQRLEGLEMFWKKRTDSPRPTRARGGPIGSFLLLERESFIIDSLLKQMAQTSVAGKAVSSIK